MQLTEAQTELRVWKQTQPGEGRQAGWQDNNQLLQKIADLQVENQQQKAESEQLKADADALQTEIGQCQGVAGQNSTECESELDRLRAELAELKALLLSDYTPKSKLTQVEQQLVKAEELLEEAHTQGGLTRLPTTYLSASNRELERLQAENSIRGLDRAQLQGDLERANGEIAELKGELSLFKSLKSGRANSSTDAEYQRQIAELSAKLKTVESEVEELKRQLAAQQRDTDRQNSNAKLQTLEVLPAQYWSPLTAAAVCV